MNTVPNEPELDLLIIGAGPAGMAAAIESAKLGARVLVVDENPAPGGQIYRAVNNSPIVHKNILGADYYKGANLIAEFRKCGVILYPETTVWMIEDNGPDSGFNIGLNRTCDRTDDRPSTQLLTAKAVLIATGALERPFPITGWTLPGVMSAGAAQTLLKDSGMVPTGRVVLAGTGPLLYLLAAQYARAGVEIEALLDTTPGANRFTAAPKLLAFARSGYFWKGLSILAEVYRRVSVVRGVTVLSAEGDGKLTKVIYAQGRKTGEIPAETLLLHQGVVPQVNLTMAAGCTHRWNDLRLAFEPDVDPFGQSSVPGLFIAGDTAGIGGANAAEASGRITAAGVAAFLDAQSSSARSGDVSALLETRKKDLLGRDFLDALYKPSPCFRMPADNVIVCRCEGVTAGQIRAIAREGAQGPNQAKAFCRSGMGPCQGRMCGLTVSELMADEMQKNVSEIGHYRIRNPVKPISVGALAETRPRMSAEQADALRLFK